MKKQIRISAWFMLLSLFLLLSVLGGCGGGDEPSEPQSITPDVPVGDVPTQVSITNPQGTQVVFVTRAPSPTFDFQIDDYSGVWGLEIEINVAERKPLPEIEQWSYLAQVALTVDQYGIISGEGVLLPTHYSGACRTIVESYAPFEYRVEGTVRDDPDNNIFFDITLIPLNPRLPETYTIDCINEDAPRTESFQYIWPILSAADQLSYSFLIEGNRSADQSFVIDASTVTNQQFDGLLLGSVMFFKQF